MKATIVLLLFSIFVSAQNKQINFFGTLFSVNKESEITDKTMKFKKDGLFWFDAMPDAIMEMVVSTLTSKLKDKNWKSETTKDLNIKLLKSNWKGKLFSFKKENNDSITNMAQLTGNYNNADRLIIIVYKTPKKVPFRIPAAFSFLVK